jgi:hypothetical protein
MTRTQPGGLALLVLLGGMALYGVEILLVRLGEPQFVPPITLGVALAFIGVILPVLAWPMRAVTRPAKKDSQPLPVNPFYATRVLLLAKAGALTGALLSGAGAGIVVFLLSRPVLMVGTVVLAAITVVGGVVLMVGSLLAERWCQIPPQQPELSGPSPAGGEPA